MHKHTTTITAANLSDHVLVGDNGGLSAITGEVSPSSAHPGCMMVETEHGTLYFEDDEQVRVLSGHRISVPLTHERAFALDPDDTGRIEVIVTLPLHALTESDLEGATDAISEAVLDGGGLADFGYTLIGSADGNALLHVEGDFTDWLADADCFDECAEHDEDCDGYCDHTDSHRNACLTVGTNPAYPNGRCGACGWGMNPGGQGCPNPDCDNDGRKVTDDGDWADETEDGQ